MKNCRFLVVVLSVAATFFSFSVNAETKRKITLGTEGAYAPFNATNSKGELIGFDIEIGNALCEAMNAECKWVTSDWDGIIPALIAKKFDAIVASMSITDERKQKIDFTSKYYTSPVSFAAEKKSVIKLFKNGIKGKTVGVQAGTVTENLVSGLFGKTADVKAYKTQDEAYLDFISGRVDLVAGDSFIINDFLATDQGKNATLWGASIDDPKYLGEGIGIGVRKGDSELQKALNDAIATIRKDGTYKKINDKYFNFDVYGAE
jgi:arginine/ornithine transport system substrate-binding protein